ncbi:MAG: NAD(P)-binding domain-containing protein [Gordonia sp. (in: high G+C Gram-positive bacteria)]
MTDIRVGFVGAGKIGEPMVRRLTGAGYRVIVYARRPDVIGRLIGYGAEIASAPGDLAAADVVIGCVFDDSQLARVGAEIIAGMHSHSIFVSHTTCLPATIETLAAQAGDRGVAVVEAPFSGTPAAVLDGRLTVMLGGHIDAIDTVRQVISAYTNTIHVTGGHGTALTVKLLNNALFAAHTQLALSALAAGRSLGISEDTLLRVLADSSGMSAAIGHLARTGSGIDAYAARVAGYLRKDVQAVRSAASGLGVDISALLTATQLGPIDLSPTAGTAT